MLRSRVLTTIRVVSSAASQMLTVGSLVAMLMVASPASAFSISTIGTGGFPPGQSVYTVSGLVEGDSFDFYALCPSSSCSLQDPAQYLQAEGVITVFDLTPTQIVLDIELTNNSTATGARLSVFGLGIDPNVSTTGSVADDPSQGGVDTDAFTNLTFGTFPNFSGVELCATPTNCAGGSNGGLTNGQTDFFRLTLNFVNPNNTGSIDLSQFAVKYQGIKNAAGTTVSYELAGCVGVCDPPTVPAPAAAVLFGLGVPAALMLGQWVRKMSC